MRITKLSLTNFRSFRETQTIEFAPVTLLFGPNSVGKSTVLLALFYLHSILKTGSCNPDVIDGLGGKIIGGFKNLVNGKDLKKSMKLKVEFTSVDDIGSSYTEFFDLFDSMNDYDLPELGLDFLQGSSDAETVALEFEIAWSFQNKTAFVKTYSVWLEDRLIACLRSDVGMKQLKISGLDYQHEYLLPQSHNNWIQGNDELQINYVSGLQEIICHGRIPSDKHDVPAYHSDISPDKNLMLHYPISFKGFAGALPVLNKKIIIDTEFDDVMTTEIVRELLSNVLVAPLDDLLSFLNSSLCIGPLRQIPDIRYQADYGIKMRDWYTGKACWDALQSMFYIDVCKINDWLNREDRLNIGYQLVYKKNESVTNFVKPTLYPENLQDVVALKDIMDGLQLSISKEDLAVNPDTESKLIDPRMLDEIYGDAVDSALVLDKNESIDKTLTLWDVQNHIEVSASEIGVGVSQVLPLVVAAITQPKGLIAIEQPELHVHPRVQVAIGDLLTQSASSSAFLVETHSEHLILRLLRRIRETSEGTIPEGLTGVTAGQVSIVYLEPTKKGVIAKSIGIDEDGGFTTKWPNGFFSERREEIF
jgi:hypothetical protein